MGAAIAPGRNLDRHPMQVLIELVASNGMDSGRATMIAAYVADRCAGLSVATVHSSANSALRHDAFLVAQLGLSRRQISAWIALVRGTRTVRRRNGRIVGGCPGLIEAAATGSIGPEQMRRFERLARVAAQGSDAGYGRRGPRNWSHGR